MQAGLSKKGDEDEGYYGAARHVTSYSVKKCLCGTMTILMAQLSSHMS